MVRVEKVRRGKAAVLAAAAILTSTLSACAPQALFEQFTGAQRGSDIEHDARIENRALEQGVDELLDQVWDGHWDLPTGGNVRSACDPGDGSDAYFFYGSWISPEETGFPNDRELAQSGISELRNRLAAQGWNELEEFDFTEDVVDVNAFGVEGAKPEAGIDWIQIIYYYEGDIGTAYPHVVVDVDSVCLVSDL